MISLKNAVTRAYITKLIGEEGIPMIEKMPEGEVTDVEISKITGVALNLVRRSLFILYENRLAEYRRERDKDSGWLTYLWRVDLHNIEQAMELELRKLLNNLQKRLASEKGNMFYVCTENCGRFLFDLAAKTNFVCPFCGAPLEFEDNTKAVTALEKHIAEIQAACA
ncbi:MAG: transcription factor [Methanosarcinales archaeon Met12]|nr:MAG: transcription factor [Methanosarcinales archaeon Met12]